MPFLLLMMFFAALHDPLLRLLVGQLCLPIPLNLALFLTLLVHLILLFLGHGTHNAVGDVLCLVPEYRSIVALGVGTKFILSQWGSWS
jgi:hypothetical protein